MRDRMYLPVSFLSATQMAPSPTETEYTPPLKGLLKKLFCCASPAVNSSTTLFECGSTLLTTPFSRPMAQIEPSPSFKSCQNPFPSSIVADTWFVLGSIRTKFPSCSLSTQSDPSPYVSELNPLRRFSSTVAVHLPVLDPHGGYLQRSVLCQISRWNLLRQRVHHGRSPRFVAVRVQSARRQAGCSPDQLEIAYLLRTRPGRLPEREAHRSILWALQ